MMLSRGASKAMAATEQCRADRLAAEIQSFPRLDLHRRREPIHIRSIMLMHPRFKRRARTGYFARSRNVSLNSPCGAIESKYSTACVGVRLHFSSRPLFSVALFSR